MNRFFSFGATRPSRRRRRPSTVVAPAACESLEDRRLLATAGISTSVSSEMVRDSEAFSFDVRWDPSGAGSADSVGMNLRIHYDSTALQFDSLSGVYAAGLSAQQDTTELSDRDDGDADTDRVTKLLWVDLNRTWPNLPVGSTLLTIQFTTLPGFGSTVVNVDASSVSDTPLPRQQVTVTQDIRPLLTGPPAQNVTARPEITWLPTTSAVSYEVWLAELTTSTNPYRRINSGTSSVIPTEDLAIGRYSAWVQATLPGGAKTDWSDLRVFEIRPRTTLSSPVGSISTATPTIQWNELEGAARYDLWIDNVSTGQSQVVRDQNVTTTSLTVNSLPFGTYLAWVQGINSAGYRGLWSSAARFTVATAPSLLTPVNPTFDTTPTFSWSTVYNAVSYDLWVRNVSTGTDQIIRQPNLTETSYTPTAALPEGSYLWWVQAKDAAGATGQWAGGRFSVGGRPEPLGPTGTTADRTPTFQWTPVGNAVQYDLWVDRIGGGGQIIRQTALATSSFTPTTDLPTGNYRFWIRALSNTGTWSIWSVEQQFTIS